MNSCLLMRLTREECCVKKIANCPLCQVIYTLWTKEKVRVKYQSGPSWTSVVRHLGSVHNVHTGEGRAKEAMAQKTIECWEGRHSAVDCIQLIHQTVGPKKPTV